MSDSTNWNMIGHAWAVDLLRRSIAGGHVAHAYLLSGPAGVGKALLALRLDPSETAYKINRRRNALASRKPVATALVAGAIAALVGLAAVSHLASGNTGGVAGVTAGGLLLGFPFAVLLHQPAFRLESVLLTAPVGWSGVPTVPVTPAERWVGGTVWAILAMLWAAAAVGLVGRSM